MTKNITYLPIEPIANGSTSLNELRFTVDYEYGGMNYFSGQINKRGIYAYFKPVSRSNGFCSELLISDTRSAGFKVLIRELGRRSEKWENKIWEALTPYKDTFAELYNAGDYHQIANLILNTCKNLK